MKSLYKILTGIVCGTLVMNGAFAAGDCSNIMYRQSHPERCKYASAGTNSSTYLMLGAGVAAAGAALVALAGGGSGSSNGGATHNSDAQYYTRLVTPTTIRRTSVGGDINVAQLESAISSGEYGRNATQYDEIQLAYSIARGYTGRGTKIAVFDTALGTIAKHAEYVIDTMNPIAPNATIEHHTIAHDTTDFLSYDEIGTIISETNGANVYNNSWNASQTANTITSRAQLANMTSQNFVDSISYAATNKDAIFVWAAGNDSSAQSGMLSSMPNVMPELNGHFVNVVAWDSENSQLADYSNACGVTKNYCITAPGTIKMSTGRTKSGTSFAAPIVSAAIATIREAWNYIDSETVVQILFDTAADLGDSGVDETYGHGMIDIEAATRPVGTPTIAISDTVSQPLQVARATRQIASGIQSANPKMAFFDKYGREFETNVADNIEPQNRGLGFERMRGDDARMKINMGDIEMGIYHSDMFAGSGFLQTKGDTTISYIATNKTFYLGNMEIFGRTQLGVANPQPTEDSLISDFSNTLTTSAYVGLRGTSWAVSVGVPDTIVNGTMNLHLADGRDNHGAIVYSNHSIDMTETPAIEYNASWRFLTAGFVDNPYGNNEFYMFAKTKLAF